MERTKCEVYSRVVGYLRPIQQWNDGKRAEWSDRTVFETKKAAQEICEKELQAVVTK